MYLLILVGVLGQVPAPHTIAQIRQELNRFDELDKVTIQAKAKVEAESNKSLPNKERRIKVQERVKGFAVLELSLLPPYKDAESAMIENLVDDACKPFDTFPVKQWYDTAHGKVWGWYDQPTGYIHYYQQEQLVVPTTVCVGGRCYAR